MLCNVVKKGKQGYFPRQSKINSSIDFVFMIYNIGMNPDKVAIHRADDIYLP